MCPCDICIVFWAKPGKLALLFMCPKLKEHDIREAKYSVVGENLSGMFEE